MSQTEQEASKADGVVPAARIAGALLVLLGLVNVVLAVISLTTDVIRLAGPETGALAVLGTFTAVLGVFVLRGRRWAMVTSLVVFGGLFVVQAFAATGGESAPALVTLAVVLVPLVLALRAGRTDGGSD